MLLGEWVREIALLLPSFAICDPTSGDKMNLRATTGFIAVFIGGYNIIFPLLGSCTNSVARAPLPNENDSGTNLVGQFIAILKVGESADDFKYLLLPPDLKILLASATATAEEYQRIRGSTDSAASEVPTIAAMLSRDPFSMNGSIAILAQSQMLHSGCVKLGSPCAALEPMARQVFMRLSGHTLALSRVYEDLSKSHLNEVTQKQPKPSQALPTSLGKIRIGMSTKELIGSYKTKETSHLPYTRPLRNPDKSRIRTFAIVDRIDNYSIINVMSYDNFVGEIAAIGEALPFAEEAMKLIDRHGPPNSITNHRETNSWEEFMTWDDPKIRMTLNLLVFDGESGIMPASVLIIRDRSLDPVSGQTF